jgi:phosphopantothenoylcysteine decarboxylase/phosphopantothenate--cysteine ligase
VTAGPTHEPIDPVRYLANRSSGRQGYSIAAAASAAGAEVILVTGPTSIPPPDGIEIVRVETALEMLAAAEKALPVDIAIMSAAVADWRPAAPRGSKWKKKDGAPAELALTANPDILGTVSRLKRNRPRLVIGFAAETENVAANAREKLKTKGCDWIVANDVSAAGGAMGGTDNEILLVTPEGIEAWPRMPKEAVAGRLIEAIAKTPEFRPQAAE